MEIALALLDLLKWVVLGAVMYKAATVVKLDNEGIKLIPILYAIGPFFFGLFPVGLFLTFKVAKFEGKNGLAIGCLIGSIAVFLLGIVINLNL